MLARCFGGSCAPLSPHRFYHPPPSPPVSTAEHLARIPFPFFSVLLARLTHPPPLLGPTHSPLLLGPTHPHPEPFLPISLSMRRVEKPDHFSPTASPRLFLVPSILCYLSPCSSASPFYHLAEQQLVAQGDPSKGIKGLTIVLRELRGTTYRSLKENRPKRSGGDRRLRSP